VKRCIASDGTLVSRVQGRNHSHVFVGGALLFFYYPSHRGHVLIYHSYISIHLCLPKPIDKNAQYVYSSMYLLWLQCRATNAGTCSFINSPRLVPSDPFV